MTTKFEDDVTEVIVQLDDKLDDLVITCQRIAAALEEANWLVTARTCPSCGCNLY